MLVISNSSPLIALSRINRVNLFRSLFKQIIIPDSVYQETVIQANVDIQRENINNAIEDNIIKVMQQLFSNLTRKWSASSFARHNCVKTNLSIFDMEYQSLKLVL